VRDEVQVLLQVKSVAVAGGPVSTLYEVTQSGPLTPLIVSVGEEVLVLGKDQRTLYRPGVGGGTSELVVEFDLPEGDALIRAAAPTRGGRFIVGDVWSIATGTLSLHRFDLKTGEVRPLVSHASSPRLFDTGHLAFQRDGTLWVAPFDLERGKLTGEPQPRLSGFVYVDFDRAGRNLVYLPTAADETRQSIRLLDSSGETVKTLVDMAGVSLGNASVSPDGRRLVYRVVSGEDGASSRVWVLDILSGLSRPITPEQDYIKGPIWTPDGRIAYSRAIGSGVITFLAMDPIPGAQPDVLLSRAPEFMPIQSFSPDGRHMLVGHTPTDGGESGIYVADVGDDESRRPFFATSAGEGGATFRPDGEWVAYETNGTGDYEIYLRPFVPDDPESAPIYPVTTSGGVAAQWSSDGRTLYYADGGNVYAVTVVTEPELSISEPRRVLTGVNGSAYSVTPDGQFVVLIEPEGAFETAREIRLILNWNLGETD
jgi:Tol biopolymer transport system component